MKVLITGGTSGIAKSVAIALAKRGHYIYLSCHNTKQALQLKENLKKNKNIYVLKLDITNKEDRQKAIELNIDVLYNHAGICQGGSILEAKMEDVRNNFEVNVFSSFQLLQDILKQMIEKDKGRIVVMSSLTALAPLPFASIYSATKATISTIVSMLQLELKLVTQNIKIILIEPGMYHTGFNQVFLDNKYNNGIYFKKYKSTIYKYEHLFFKLGEKKKLKSIVKQIIKAIEDENPKRIYRAPKGQAILSKIVNMFK